MTAMTEERAKLTSAERDALPDSAFALPGRRYPIHDENHARAALSEVSQHGTPDEKAKVRAAVHKRYPHIGAGESKSAQHDPAWEQRRKRWAGSLVGKQDRRSLDLVRGDVEIRAKPDGTGGTNFEFNGYASTFNEPFQMFDKWGDEFQEDVWDVAFQETLRRPDLDTPFLIGHNEADIPMARTRSGTLRLATDTRGLHANAPDLDGRNDQVRRLASAVERGDMDEMSIGFICRGQEWSEDYSKRHLTSIDLHRGDVSVVALAANPATRGVSMVALPTESLSRQAAAQREEQRGNPVDQGLGDASDFEPNGGTMTHTDRATCGGTNPSNAKFCSWCGDALVRLDDQGVPAMEEEQGEAATLGLKRRQLELLMLVR